MRDHCWKAAYGALLPHLRPQDIVLAPKGEWFIFPCRVNFYDELIDLQDANVLMLHKGRLPGIRKADMAEILGTWSCLHANRVFVVFTRDKRQNKGVDRRMKADLLEIKVFLESAARRRFTNRIIYVHLPKSGGTAMWQTLLPSTRSRIYYRTVEAFLCNPPAEEDYDLIGIHFAPSLIMNHITERDWVLGLVRQPAERLLSAVLHSRRTYEDPETFVPSMRAMRELPLEAFLQTPDGQHEACIQLYALGKAADHQLDQDILENALALIGRERSISPRAIVQGNLWRSCLAYCPSDGVGSGA